MRTLLVALVLTLAACAHGEATVDEDGNSLIPSEQEGPPGSFDLDCRFGISGCERQAASRCGTGYRVLSTYRTTGAFGTPYWYMKAICARGENTGQ